MLMFGLRLGDDPRMIVTTTPRPTRPVKDLLAKEGKGVVVTRGSTMDNADNLAPGAVALLRARYEGTALGRQELFGEMVEEVPGSLWRYEDIRRWDGQAEEMDLDEIVIGVDPSGGNGPQNDEVGIVAAGRTLDQRIVVGRDASLKATPEQWGRAVVRIYDELQADRVVAERNYGGDMVPAVLKSAARAMFRAGERPDDHIRIEAITSSRGKALRAQPVAALYGQGRVFHGSVFHELESEMVRFTSDWSRSRDGSPNRLDALVFCINALTERMPSLRRMVFGRVEF